MDTQLFTNYLKDLQAVLNRKDGREESFYPALAKLIEGYRPEYLHDCIGRSFANPIHYCRIATAMAHTIRLQAEIDPLYKQVDEDNARDCDDGSL